MDNKEPSLSVAIHGMSSRLFKMMVIFFQGPCDHKVVIVQEDEAEAEIIDIDTPVFKSLLEKKLQQTPQKPLIVLSIKDLSHENFIFVKKPVQTARLQEAITNAKGIVENNRKKTDGKFGSADSLNQQNGKDFKELTGTRNAKRIITLDVDEPNKTSKHKTAIYLDKQGFSSFIGSVPGIDFSNPHQVKEAYYNAKDYYQGYVQSAIKFSIKKNRIFRLNSGWKPLIIFPQNREVWVDADDKQLRAFSSIPIKSISSTVSNGITLTPLDHAAGSSRKDLDKYQSIEAFLWKLAIWTSKGRYPQGIDINKPVYLKRWPNFTRLVIPPHALRITALLMDGPRTLTNVSEVLNIKPQYVFAFFSAVHTTGLAGQTECEPGKIVEPVRSSDKKGLLTRILHKLSGSMDQE